MPRGKAHDHETCAAEAPAGMDGLIFEYLEQNFKALAAQARMAADETYLRQWPPQHIGLLHGVMADKAVRLLEALQFQPAEREEEAPGEQPADS